MIQFFKRSINRESCFVFIGLLTILFAYAVDASAHGVTAGDKGYIQESSGTMLIPFIYLGAKHMVTGYEIGRAHV